MMTPHAEYEDKELKMGKDILSIKDLNKNEIKKIFKLTDLLKNKRKNILEGKNIALVFTKPSTRTRVSFEVAINHLGGNAIYLDMITSQLGRGEAISDTAKVLGRYVDGIVARLFSHRDMLELAENSPVPVINALDDLFHPCQVLSDMYTVKKKLGKFSGLKLVFLGDGGSNVCHSLMYACSKFGLEMIVSCPRRYSPGKKILREANAKIVSNPKKAVEGADIIYTDTWVSMGKEREKRSRIKELKPYQVNKNIVSLAKPHVMIMHDLPAYRDMEITNDVMDGPRSIIFDQAENRLHTAKGILAFLLG